MEFNILIYIQLIVFFIFGILYLILNTLRIRKEDDPDWNFKIKKLWVWYNIWKWKANRKNDKIKLENSIEESVFIENTDSFDSQTIWAGNKENYSIYIHFVKKGNRIAELALILYLPDGSCYYLPNQPDTMVFNSGCNSWAAGDLKLILLKPFMRWRLVFNGLLSKRNENFGENIHVKLNFIWIAGSDPFKIPDECSNILLAEVIASRKWKSPYLINSITDRPIKGYDQFGNLSGIIKLGNSEQEIQCVLIGVKKRRWGLDYLKFVKKSVWLTGILVEGTMFSIDLERNNIGIGNYLNGCLRAANGEIMPIDHIDKNTLAFCDSRNMFNNYNIKLQSNKKEYKISMNIQNLNNVILRGGRPWKWEKMIHSTYLKYDKYKGLGIFESWNHYKGECPLQTSIQHEYLEYFSMKNILNEKICVSFQDKRAFCPELVGAKGASLALLSSIKKDEYKVPDGFCITTKGLEIMLQENSELLNAIENIEKSNEYFDLNNIKEQCQITTQLFTKYSLPLIIQEEIEIHYNKLCSCNNVDNLYFAVRSSGIGEDSEELSAAGQNETILGCKSLNDIFIAIQKCWASLFTFQSIEYRRQHGQNINCGMGIVIQIMVNSQSAGVMFTRNPTTGDPNCILITSNFGLGDTVVSGKIEPDHIYIKKDLKNNLRIDNIQIGSKTHKVEIDKLENNTNSHLKYLELNDDSNKCSLTEEECTMLGRIATIQENLWGSSRDIEWAICNGVVYLLQVRPITCLYMWTEYELLHELDSPIMSKYDLMTFGNTGEVMPRVISPLSYSVVTATLNDSMFTELRKKEKIYYMDFMASTHHRISINVFNTIYKMVPKEINLSNKVGDIAVFGHPVINKKIHSIALYRFGSINIIQQLSQTLSLIKKLWISEKIGKEALLFSKNVTINLNNCKSAIEMYQAIENNVSLNTLSYYHSISSNSSFFAQLLLFLFLIEGKNDFTHENYVDIGMILSSCSNIVSAEVPLGLSYLAKAIKNSGKSSDFCNLRPENGIEWLRENCLDIYYYFENFLKQHGHRGLCEFDIAADTWEANPVELINVLQKSLQSPLEENDAILDDDISSKLISPKKYITKKILKLIIPICQKSVAAREATKSSIILGIHQFRIAYKKLALQMKKEWRLPDEKLIFFLTHDEIGKYLHTRNPEYIQKATLRQRYFSKWDTFKFSELNWDIPKPINNIPKPCINDSETNICVSGTPVYLGSVTGRACVIHHLSEINKLEKGDILITNSTDIGWSPYFPLLSGVVTELGGLISHGAVVAREYGLPCIVGTESATTVFKTGDTVLLDATNGSIKKIKL